MSDPGSQSIGYRGLITLAAVVVVVAGLRASQAILIPLMLAVFLAVLGLPSLTWLQRHRVPKWAAVVLVLLGMIGFIAFVGTLVGRSLNDFLSEMPKYQERLEELTRSVRLPASSRGFTWMVKSQDTVGTGTVSGVSEPGGDEEPVNLAEYVNPGAVMQLIGVLFVALAAALSNTVLVMLAVAFILLEAAGIPRKLRVAMGRPEADLSRYSRMAVELQRYLTVKTVISLATGLLLGLWTWVLGVDFPILWGLVAFMLNYIPNLGSVIAAVPPILLALVQTGALGLALGVAAGYLAVNMVLGNIIEPLFMGRKFGLSTLVVFLSLVFWGWVWGPVGMFLSVPLTMVLKILMENSREFRWVAVLLGPSGGEAAGRSKPKSQSKPAGS